MRTSALFGAKTSDYSKFMVYLHGQERLSHCERFADKWGEGSILRDFVGTSFLDGS